MLKRILFFIVLSFTCSNFVLAQTSQVNNAKRYISENAKQWQLTADDCKDMYISDNYTDDGDHALTHIYFIQRHDGIQFFNGVLNIHVMPNGEILHAASNFMPNLKDKINASKPKLTYQDALNAACQHLNLLPQNWIRKEDKGENKIIFDKGLISYEDISVQLVYQRISDQEARLAYDIAIDAVGGQDYWSVRIDALSGALLEKDSWTKHCKFHDHKAQDIYNQIRCEEKQESKNFTTTGGGNLETGTYNVFPFPTESPIHGSRKLLVKPVVDSLASPYGWHDTDGIAGAPNYTITRGNNVHAYDDSKNNNKSLGGEPNGGVDLKFDFPYSDVAEPATMKPAAIVNLFYVNNFMHDLSHHYGMNEKGGAFQFNNYGKSTTGAKDEVYAEAQDGSGVDNANFATPPDGQHPRMQMYSWTGSSSNLLKIETPVKIAGTYSASNPSSWGKKVTVVPFTAQLVNGQDNTGSPTLCCKALVNDVKGKIAVIDRGVCEFGAKALNAQNKGAVGVIIVNFEPSPAGMAAGASGAKVTIPVISVGSKEGYILRQAMKDTTVTVSFVLPAAAIKPDSVDGDFDNGIIAHEYGHGISNRLTGGPNLASCLNNRENMGEGWSDFMALITTAKPGDTGAKARGVGNFANRSKADGVGIRTSPYSTDMSINPNTYDQSTAAETHRLGEVWTSMCWDLYWKMTDKYGFDPDVVNGKGGNNKAIKLIFDGMKLQKCQPGFVDGRDAILAADKFNFNGENQCLIWESFARRGLGTKASQGSSLTSGDAVENYSVMPECIKTLKIEKEVTDLVKAGGEVTVKLYVRNDKGGTANNAVVTDIIPTGCTYVNGSATKGGTVSGGTIVFKLGNFATGKADTLTYKFLTDSKSFSKSKYFEGFDTDNDFDKWVVEALDQSKSGTSWIPQAAVVYKGAKAAGAPMEDSKSSDVGLWMDENKPVIVTGKQPVLRFYHNDFMQAGYDGMLVSASKDKGDTWTDLGKSIFKNGYNGRIAYSTIPIPNQYTFWGNSGGWIPTYVDLGQYAGDSLIIRFRFVSDTSVSNGNIDKGVFLDNVEIMDMINYNTEATLTADSGEKVVAIAGARGTKIETDRATVSTVDPTGSLKVDIFPNPTDTYVNINIVSSKAGNADITLYDANGRLVKKESLSIDGSQLITLETSSLPAGLYTVKVNQNNAFIVSKLIVF